MKRVIKWTNKMSGETGYVKSVSRARGCFINTWDKSDAKKYQTDKQIDKDMQILEEVGEAQNNQFDTEEV